MISLPGKNVKALKFFGNEPASVVICGSYCEVSPSPTNWAAWIVFPLQYEPLSSIMAEQAKDSVDISEPLSSLNVLRSALIQNLLQIS